MLKRHISIGVFVAYIDTRSPLPNIPSKSRGLADENKNLEWRAGLSDTILKETHPGTIPARFGLIWFSGFRGEDLNAICYQNNCSTLSQNVPKFELYKHNDELFNMHYRIFYEL
jgi:hypothetical protein